MLPFGSANASFLGPPEVARGLAFIGRQATHTTISSYLMLVDGAVFARRLGAEDAGVGYSVIVLAAFEYHADG